jgi:hypothetical protein
MKQLDEMLPNKAISAKNILKNVFKKIWWILPIAGMGIIFWLFYNGEFPLKGKDIAEKGQFGDSFGVLNSLFTGLGFGGLIVTLILQQKQISQQETEIKLQRQSDETRHYEETLHRLLALYAKTLSEVSNVKGDLKARSVLRGSTDRVFEAIKDEKAQIIPLRVQERYSKKQLTNEDESFLDYLYFRNFKILTVEIDRQGRLTETLKVLLRHLLYGAPSHLTITPYLDLVCSQITYVELSYFFLVTLTFKKEEELRDLYIKSGLLEKAAYIKRMKIHDYMYEQFWGKNIRQYKEPQHLPINDMRINNAVRAYRKKTGGKAADDLKSYTSPRTQH